MANLVSAGLLDPARSHDAEAVVARSLGEPVTVTTGDAPPARKVSTRALLVEVGAYVGGALVVTAVVLFLGQEWHNFSETARVATLAGAAVLLAAAGLVVPRVAGGYAELRAGRDETRRRLTSALLTAGSLAAAFAVALQVSNVIDEPTSAAPVAAGSATMLVLAACGYAYAWSGLGLVAMVIATVNGVMNTWGQLDERGEHSWVPALVLLAFAVLWLVLTETRRFHEPAVARLAGMLVAIFGAQMARNDESFANLAYALLLAVAVTGFAMYLRTAAWPYLVGGVLGVTIVVPEAIIDWTGGALGPAGGVLIAGLALLGASLAGFRMRKEVAEEPETPEGPADPAASGGTAGSTENPPSVHLGG